MRPKRSYLQYAQDMLAWCLRAENHLGNTPFEEFITNTMMMDAVVQALDVVGEAANKVPPEYQEQHPQIPRSQIVGARNRMIHDYPNTDYRVVYDTVRYSLRPMYPHLHRLIRQIEEDES